MRILISGSHGFIGEACVDALKGQGHEVVRLVRSEKEKKPDTICWNPARGRLRKEDFEGFDAVVHLAGKNILSRRWSKKFKREVFVSRCRDTWLLCDVLLRLRHPPKTFLMASAIGFYGDRGDEVLTEEASQGSGFLADLVGRWEASTAALESRGVRVVSMRFGVVLSSGGGMLAAILSFYKVGPCAILGSGRQWMSWIGLSDLLKIVQFCLTHEEIRGVVNVTTPFPVTQEEFTKLLAKQLKKRVFLKIPAFILKFGMGEMAGATVLSSTKVYPRKLLDSGYDFFAPKLDLYFLSETL